MAVSDPMVSGRQHVSEPAAVSARPSLAYRRGRRGRFSAAHIVAWQVAAVAVVAGLVSDDWSRYVGVGAGALIVVFTLVPVGHRWLYQWCLARMRFWWRIPRTVTDPHVEPRLVPLREVLPDIEVIAIEGRGGQRIGIVYDGVAWTAVVGVHTDDDILPTGEPAPALPIRSLADVLAVDDIRLAAVRVLAHTMPAPSGLLGGQGPALSYNQLASFRVPAGQLAWVALRLDPQLCPDAIIARGGGIDGVGRALRRCIARTVEVLSSAGIRAAALDEEELRANLALSAGVAARSRRPGTRHTLERWHTWSCDGVAHVTYWLGHWPDQPTALAAVAERLTAVPTLFATLALTLLPDPDRRVRFHALARL